MAGCVLTATLGMMSVVWYAFGGQISDEEMEAEARAEHRAKKQRVGEKGIMRSFAGWIPGRAKGAAEVTAEAQ